MLGLSGASRPSALSSQDECSEMPITVLRPFDRGSEEPLEQSYLVSVIATGEA